MRSERSSMALAALAMAVAILCLSTTPSLVRAQSGDQSCATSLIPCADYINSTKPPSSCCNPLKEALRTQLTCLCNIFNTPGLLKSFNINVTEALLLPQRCHISGVSSTNICSSSPTAAPTASPTSPGSSTTPSTSTPSTSTPSTSQDKNAAESTAWSGVSAVLVSLALMMFFY